MKKVLSAILVILLAVAYFCFFDKDNNSEKDQSSIAQIIEKDSTMYPFYNRLSQPEKDAYIKIVTAIKNFDESISNVYKADTKSEVENFVNQLNIKVYREIAYENPEIFWFDPYNFEATVSYNGKDEYSLQIKPAYLFNKQEVEQMNTAFQREIEKIVSIAKTKPNTYEQVLYVHDYILENCVYDHKVADNDEYTSPSINAYGCLVNGKAICSGYSMAFSTIMKRLGYEIGVEFNSYDSYSFFSEGHVWNYCNLDGDYYYFDLTWDDIDPSNEDMYNRINYYHSFFAITKDELAKAHLTLAPQAETPDCNGTKYNYFIYNNINFSKYSFETIKPAIRAQAGEDYIQLRFDKYSELLAAERSLLTEKKIFEIFPEAKSYRYYISKSKLQLYIFVNDFYLN